MFSPIAHLSPSHLRRFLPLCAALCAVALAQPLVAASASWHGGSGNWSSTSNPGWADPVAKGIGATATLSAANSTLTTITQDVSGGVTLGSLIVSNTTNAGWTITNTNGITLNQDTAGSGSASITNNNNTGTTENYLLFSSGTITLADNLRLTNNSTTSASTTNGAIRLGSVVAGTGNITVSNVQTPLPTTAIPTGTVQLSAANTFTGSVLVQKGTLYINVAGGLGSASNAITIGASGQGSAALIFAGGGTLANNITIASGTGGTSTFGHVTTNSTVSGTITLDGNLAYQRGTGTSTFSGQVTGAGKFTHTAGNLRLTNSTNDYSGGTTISGGTLFVQGNGQLGSGAVQVDSGATLSFANITPSTYTLSSTLSGTGTVAIGAKTLTLLGQVSPGTAGAGTLTLSSGGGLVEFGAGTSFAYTLGTSSTALAFSDTTLGLGSGVIEFGDFSFTTGAGFDVGQYTLISGAAGLNGSLGSTLSGAIGSGYAGTLSMSGNNLVLDVTAIPEPSTYAALAGAAMLGLAVVRRRIRAKA